MTTSPAVCSLCVQEAASTLDLPLVSFLHGVVPSLPQPLEAGRLVANETDLPRAGPLADALNDFRTTLYADCGENQHFNEYGHRVMGHLVSSAPGGGGDAGPDDNHGSHGRCGLVSRVS
jgi:hypothetical protein